MATNSKCRWRALGVAAAALALSFGSARLALAGNCLGGAPNGVVESGEACDDGNTNDNDNCRNTCACAACGDRTVRSQGNCDNNHARNCTGNVDCIPDGAGGVCLLGNYPGCPVQAAVEQCEEPYVTKHCVGGTNAGATCTGAPDCPSGTCTDNQGLQGCSTTCQNTCGNNVRDFVNGESCDRACNAGANVGKQCTAASDCPGGTCPAGDPDSCGNHKSCLGGSKNGQVCLVASDCPGGTCDAFTTPENTPCTATCGTNTSGCDNCGDGTVSGTETCERPFSSLRCSGGTNSGNVCSLPSECPGGTCANGTIGCDNACANQCGLGTGGFGQECDLHCVGNKSCRGGSKNGQVCLVASDCPNGTCAGNACNHTCVGGTTPGGFCFQDNDCLGTGATCTGTNCADGSACTGFGNIDDCSDVSTCLGGSKAGTTCTVPANCPGGKCSPLERGNVGCNANCTTNLNCSQCGDGVVGNGETCDPPRAQMICKGGDNDGQLCGANSDCPGGGTCGVFAVCVGGPKEGNACTTTLDCCQCEGDLATLACGICYGNAECGQGVAANDLACTLYVCGNGVPEAGEMCDRGTAECDSFGDSDGQPCDTPAQVKACIDTDGGTCVNATTGANCTPTTCNGAIFPGPNACRADCRLPSCGDGVADTGETCDDGFATAPNAGALDAADDCPNGAALLCLGTPGCNIKPLCDDGIPHLLDSACRCDPGTVATCTNGCGCQPRCKGGGSLHGQVCCTDADCVEPADDPGVCLNPCLEPCDNGGGDLLLCLLGTPGSADCTNLAVLSGGVFPNGIPGPATDDCMIPGAIKTCAGALQQCVNDANCGANGPCGNSDTTGNACRTDCALPKCGDDVKDNKFGEGCDNGVGACASGSSGKRCQGGTTTACSSNAQCGPNGICNFGNGFCEKTCGADSECPAGQTCQMPWRLVTQCTTGMMTGSPCDSSAQCGPKGTCTGVYKMVMICDGNGAECGSASDPGKTDCSPFPGQLCKSVAGRECKSDNDCDDNPPCQIDPAEGTSDCTNKCINAASFPGESNGGAICDAENPDGTPADLDNCNGQTPGQCSMFCAPPGCGNGIIEVGEDCDNGANNGVSGNCTTGCTLNQCGDGQRLEDEACDDGDADNCDACNQACAAPECGDGFLCPPETCDDGNNESADGCSSVCCAEPSGNLTVDQKFAASECTEDQLDAAIAASPAFVQPRLSRLASKADAKATDAQASLPGNVSRACRRLRSASNRLLSVIRLSSVLNARGSLPADDANNINNAASTLIAWYSEIRSQLGCKVPLSH